MFLSAVGGLCRTVEATDMQRALVLSGEAELMHVDERESSISCKDFVCEATVRECYFYSSLEQPTGIEPI